MNLDELQAEILRQRRGHRREVLILAAVGTVILAVAACVVLLFLL